MSGYEFIITLKDQASSGLDSLKRSIGLTNKYLEDLARTLKEEAIFYFRVLNDVVATATVQMRDFNQMINVSGGSTSALKAMIGTATDAVTAYVQVFVEDVMAARIEYENFRAALTNTFQSKDIGEAALNMLMQFAEKTPFKLEEVVGGFKELVKGGINPTKAELYALGNLAVSQGKSFDQMTEAVLDAQNGQFDKLREFGMTAKRSGDVVGLSFNGITKTVKNNQQAIRDAIVQYGGMKGVAGSMQTVSETLGGRVESLKNQWKGFLSVVGGESGGLFSWVISLLGKGLAFLTEHLSKVSKWFEILWSKVEPLVALVWNFVKAFTGFKDIGSSMEVFGSIMNTVLLVIDWFSTGVVTLNSWLQPLAGTIGVLTALFAGMNLVLAMSPIGWMIIGIVSLISVIGMVTKYTDGWAKSWQALKTMLSLVWEQIKADFSYGAHSIIYGFSLIYLHAKDLAERVVGTFSNIGEAIKMALSGNFTGAFRKVTEEVKTKAQGEIAVMEASHKAASDKYNAESAQREKAFANAKKDFGITVDTKGASKDFNNIKNQVLGNKTKTQLGDTAAYDDYALKNRGGIKGLPEKSGSSQGEGITGGGSKQTTVTINVAKMQDQIVINTVNSGEGALKMRQLIEEELNRLLASAFQLQTT